jgi:hypothetical protein
MDVDAPLDWQRDLDEAMADRKKQHRGKKDMNVR